MTICAVSSSYDNEGEPAVSWKSTTRHKIGDIIFRNIFSSNKPPIARYYIAGLNKTKLK